MWSRSVPLMLSQSAGHLIYDGDNGASAEPIETKLLNLLWSLA